MTFESQQEIERKVLGILRVLSSAQEPAGASKIARDLKTRGIDLGERAVRYHLRLTDERGLTQLVTRRDGRVITDRGLAEIRNAMVADKVGFAISRIESLAYRTEFDVTAKSGSVPVNIALFPRDSFGQALKLMAPAFESGLCVSSLVAILPEGERIGDLAVPPDRIGLATVCSIVVNGVLLKAGVPMDSRFGGLMQLRDRRPVRFTEMIHYDGSSMDPSEIFIKARMTSVIAAARTGEGQVLANFREIPAICRPVVDSVLAGLNRAGLNGVLAVGEVSQPVCELEVQLNRSGIVLMGGLNPVAAAIEGGCDAEIHSMTAVISYQRLTPYSRILADYH